MAVAVMVAVRGTATIAECISTNIATFLYLAANCFEKQLADKATSIHEEHFHGFVNLLAPDLALRFWKAFHSVKLARYATLKVLELSWTRWRISSSQRPC